MALTIAFAATVGACTPSVTQRAPVTSVAPDANTNLVAASTQPLDIGDPVKVYDVPFTLARVPNPARLHLNFVMTKGGFCPDTYRPTVVRLNDRTLGEIDFRRLNRLGLNDVPMAIPAGMLKAGENTLRITTGSCQFGIDAMRVNTLTLVQRE